MPGLVNLWQPAAPPDPSKAPPMDLTGIAGSFLGGYQVGGEFKEARNARADFEEAGKKGMSSPSTLDFLNKYNITPGPDGVKESDLQVPGGLMGGLARSLLSGETTKQAAEDPYFAVKQKANQQAVQLGELKLQEAMKQRDDALQTEVQMQGFTNVLQTSIREGKANEPSTQAEVLDFLGRNPSAPADPRVKGLLDQFGISRKILQQKADLEEKTQARTQAISSGMTPEVTIGPKGVTEKFTSRDVMPEVRVIPSPVASTPPVSVLTDGKRWERIPESSLGRQLNVMETKALYAADPSLLVHDPNTGALMADPTRPDAVQRALQVGAGITSATRSKAEEGVSKLAEVINTAQEEIANVQAHPEALGIMGAGRSALEIAKGVAGVSSDATVTNARDRLRENFTRLAKTLRTDSGNMSHYEQVQLHEVGDLTKLDQYPGRAIPLMQNILNAAVGQKLRKLKELNKPIDTQTFQAIQPSEVQGLYDSALLQNKDLLDLVKAGKVDKAKVREIIVNKPKG